jgi:opacity protein-like surface antigen
MKAKLLCALACAALSSSAFATEAEHPTQRDRFAACAHESKGLKGDEHQKFMSDCLKGNGESKADAHKTSASTGASQQQNRMRTCNDEARTKDLHGDERRAFMSTCLKG